MAFAPEPNERQLARGSAFCDTLGIVVYLYDVVDLVRGTYRCVCGSVVRRQSPGGQLTA